MPTAPSARPANTLGAKRRHVQIQVFAEAADNAAPWRRLQPEEGAVVGGVAQAAGKLERRREQDVLKVLVVDNAL